MMRNLIHRSGGFSLIEAMVVMVVLGIVLAAAIPNLSSSNKRHRIESAATALASRIQIARQRAVATRVPHRLVMDTGNRTYWTEQQDGESTWIRFPDEEYELPIAVEWSVRAGGEQSNTDVEFEGRGTVLAEDAPLAVTFSNAQGDTFSLSLVRTGRVVVRSGTL